MWEKNKYFIYFTIIACVILGVSILYPFIVNSFFSDWNKSGTFGDTFGALNAIFSGIAVAGLIITILLQRKELENQRIELGLQRTEMQETRKEFSINRITGVIYNQLERYEKAVEQFAIKDGNNVYNGYQAFFFLDDSIQRIYTSPFDTRTPLEILTETKQKNCSAMKLYSSNDQAIAQFALSAYNSVTSVEEILLRSDLTAEEINDLKNLFFRNIGFIQLGVLTDISEKYMQYLKLSINEEDNYIEECDIDAGKLGTGHIFLQSILKFRETFINVENLKEVKEKWIRDFGTHA